MNNLKELPNSDGDAPQKQPSSAMTIALFVLLVLWVLSIATGTILFGKVVDWRKPMLVLLPMGLFLTLWAVLLLRKQSRR
ncbi:MAG: hypothetical protein AAGA30_09150 [Planctomycetota bacterium]